MTSHRERLLKDSSDLLVDSLNDGARETGSVIIAYTILPDHFHAIIDPKESDISAIVKRVKLKFSYKYRERNRLYKCTLWQPRFWDHIIRDEVDMNRHIDYIHYNPVKHGYVHSPFDWPYTSLHEYRKQGHYTEDWGLNAPGELKADIGE